MNKIHKIMSGTDLKSCLNSVLSRIEQSVSKRNNGVGTRLVAVSKTKPAKAIIEAYEAGQRHFGENYVQELEEKAHNPLILEKCKEIQWHFIGHLQGNKVNKVINIPNLYIVETVDSKKLATKLNHSFKEDDSKLRIFVQVNTSGEKEKSGIQPTEVVDMVKFVKEECPKLQFDGLMTIGQYGYNMEDGPNPDFLNLVKCRKELCEVMGLPENDVELSMGMSTDYEHAIDLGSTNVRVGSTIFGSRG